MTRVRIMAAAAVTVAAALAATSASAVGAANPLGWRVVYRHVTLKSFSAYRAVAVQGRTEAWAVGGTGVAGLGSPIAAYWHRGKWSVSPIPSRVNNEGDLVAVSSDAPGDAWALSVLDVLHWHDGTWTVAHKWRWCCGPPGPLVTGITAFSSTNVWVFGGSGDFAPFNGLGTWHLHGRSWSRVTGVGGDIDQVSAISAANMWAIGGIKSGDGSILHFTAGRWHIVRNAALAGLKFGAIFASRAGGVWVTAWTGVTANGISTSARLLHLANGRWTAYPIPWPVRLSGPLVDGAISPDGRGGFWIPTEGSFNQSPFWMLHWRSGTWSRVDIGANAIFGLTLIPGTMSLWGAGGFNRPRSADGLVWADGRVG